MFSSGIQDYFEKIFSKKEEKVSIVEKEQNTLPIILNLPVAVFGFSTNAAQATMIIEDIVSNRLDKINIITAIDQIKKYLFADNFLDLLDFTYNREIGKGSSSEKYNELEKGFYGYYYERLPLLLRSGSKHKNAATEEECSTLGSYCLSFYCNKKNIDISKYIDSDESDQYRIFFEDLMSNFIDNQEIMKKNNRFFVSQKNRDNTFYSIAYNFHWLERILEISDRDWEENKNSVDYVFSLIIKKHYKLFWDTFDEYIISHLWLPYVMMQRSKLPISFEYNI